MCENNNSNTQKKNNTKKEVIKASMYTESGLSPVTVAKMFIDTQGDNIGKISLTLTTLVLVAATSKSYSTIDNYLADEVESRPSFIEAIAVWEPIRKIWENGGKWNCPALYLAGQCLLETETWMSEHRVDKYRRKIGGADSIFSCDEEFLSDEGKILAKSLKDKFSLEEIYVSGVTISKRIRFFQKCLRSQNI